jgi:tRNA dimethylallyltransferase
MDKDVLVLTGATSTGKSALALEVARRTGAEIISVDSRQVYRAMDIGTAKLTPAERAGIPHHGLDLVAPNERYSAGRFARDTWRFIADIRSRGRPILLVGGTGFFLRALTHPFFGEPELPASARASLERYLDNLPEERLRFWAAELEGTSSVPGDRQRLTRIVEVATLSGHSLGWWHRNAPPVHTPLEARVVVLELPRAVLYQRIEARVLEMVRQGLVEEVRALRAAGYGTADPGMNATGYREVLAYIEGHSTLAQAISLTQAATRRYARRQLTWFRHQLPDGAIHLDARTPTDELATCIVRTLMWEEVAV